MDLFKALEDRYSSLAELVQPVANLSDAQRVNRQRHMGGSKFTFDL
ncbi:hypothetical protein IC229_31820 [Spirosoma sp. BT702]|uniref:Uncharacterized protein n=1 Tax=Spirosoma profusum TaxID=2771354 RepID=A0A927GAN6_9BACT|nr:hypothetical protein [Spirosoma profusum]MBD2705250.1 hypothetical protein [Spirosoma profusum]